MKITVVGAGYVGLSLATLLSKNNEVYLLDIVKEKLDMINNKISPIKDKDIEDYLQNKKLNLKTTLDYKEAFTNSKFIIIATPTDYNISTKVFDTKSVEESIKKIIEVNSDATIIIKSTIPIGYTKELRKKYKKKNIIFSPEFLREGKALYDNLYPSRIIIGDKSKKAREFGNILKNSSLKKDVVIKYMDSNEAESVKLFSNTYLALRISFFNELDTFALEKGLNTKDIIDGVCLDPRIGDFYNNPSFGYGGYCLPKDTKQLLSNYKNIPQNLIESIIKSNDTRKHFIAEDIINKKPKLVGIYKLSMKKDSDNYRQSAIMDIISILKDNNIDMIIYDKSIKSDTFNDIKVVNDLKQFKEESSIILANRIDKELNDVNYKIYTRDILFRD